MMSVQRQLNCVYMVSLLLFVTSCYWKVNSAETKPSNEGALTVVDNIDDDLEALVETEEDEQLSSEVFYPTKDWQVIKPGQAIPKGLHVRMNLETGLKEAKLMDGDDGLKYWKEGDKEGMVNTDKKDFTTGELKEALKMFKENQDDVQDEKIREEALKKKFRSIEELKRDMKTIQAQVKTDLEIVQDVLNTYKATDTTVEMRVELLDEMEYLLHQIDNAVSFADMGGITEMLKGLNDTDHEDIRSGAAFVLGAAAQSNPKVQIKAFEAGVLQQLIRMINTETSIKLKNRVLYALSSMIRHFPLAQQKFLQLGGVNAMLTLFHVPSAEKLQIKTVSLMNDLLSEQDLSEKHLDESNTAQMEKNKQYKSVPLLNTLLENGWCNTLPSLLVLTDHDSREKVLNAMNLVSGSCRREFKKSVNWLEFLENEYRELSSADEDGDNYFETMADKARTVVDRLLIKREL